MNLLTLWSENLGLSVAVWVVLIITMMYLSRPVAKRSLSASASAVRNSLHLSEKAISIASQRMSERNKQVLLASGREMVEKTLVREFQRVNAVVDRDLSGYPELYLQLRNQIAQIDEDYRNATEIPPSAPGWVEPVKAIAKLRNNNSEMVSKILEDIHSTIIKSEKQASQDYRDAMTKRHGLLKRMLPYWRNMNNTLEKVNNTIEGLDTRAKLIDGHMSDYEAIHAASDDAARKVSSSSLTQFFISGFVLAIAVMGGVVNYHLIALPMSEMVGGNSMIGQFKASDISALVIILLEVAMGFFLMESLRITRLFPVIGSMDDVMRRRMVVVTLTLLTILASIESSLAFMRDLLAADKEALTQTLSGVAAINPEFRWIPSVGQMVMGFALPFVLTFVAIPFESFIHSSRTVLGMLAVAFLQSLAFTCRMLANLFVSVTKVMMTLYDFIIFIPLRFEEMKHHHDKKTSKSLDKLSPKKIDDDRRSIVYPQA